MIFFFLQAFCYVALFDFQLFKRAKRGQALFLKIFDIEEDLYSGQIPGVYQLADYKFFSSILGELLEYSRVYGLPPNFFIPRLREYLSQDLRSEKEVEKAAEEAASKGEDEAEKEVEKAAEAAASKVNGEDEENESEE